MIKLPVHHFLTQNPDALIVDVRSPGEYQKGHIPKSVNIPLFENDERAEVGITYKQFGKRNAIKEGLKIAGPKMSAILDHLEKHVSKKSHKQIRVYCWRGGMRSANMAWLFETAGYECQLLEGGYKSYRNLMSDIFEELEINLLAGETGSGKTEVLKELRNSGEQVVDLEALANHKGSVFGGIGEKTQPTNEHFQNLVIQEFLTLDPSKRVFLEDESSHIGKVSLPDTLWKKMKTCPLIYIQVPLEDRIAHLVRIYGSMDKEELNSCISKIEKKLGGQNVKKAVEYLNKGDLSSTARILLHYYDKSYRFLLDRKRENIICKINIRDNSPLAMSSEIRKFLMYEQNLVSN